MLLILLFLKVRHLKKFIIRYHGDGCHCCASKLVVTRWECMLDTADVTRKFIETIIEIIGRKTSEEYAAVTIRNLVQKLQGKYPFLQNILVKNSRYLEIETQVEVNETLNSVAPKRVGVALKELMTIIMTSIGKTAGYFFIRETREKIGIDYDKMLLKMMDVDLTIMQSMYIVEKKSNNLLDIQNEDIVRRFVKSLIAVLEKQTSKSFTLSFVSQQMTVLQERYPFLKTIGINDIRYTLGSEEVMVQSEINDIPSQELGKAILSLLQNTDKTLLELGRNSIAGDLKSHLTLEYLSKLGEMGVTITPYSVGYSALFRQVIKTLIDVIEKTSSENYALIAVNSFLRKLDSKYQFLKQVSVEPPTNKDELYHIMIAESFDGISETDARRAIQQLLVLVSDTMGDKIDGEFIEQFKEALEKKYLSKLEELGVNFHMIELHQALSTQ